MILDNVVKHGQSMILSNVIALDPTCKQRVALTRAAGVSRFSYNWGLAEWNRQYSAGEKPDANKLRKEFNAIKGELYPWIYDSPKDANQQSTSKLIDEVGTKPYQHVDTL